MSAMMSARSRPCAKCPFRKDVPNYLRAGRRVEIATAIANGHGFPCHETTVSVEDDDGMTDRAVTAESKFCAGAIKAAIAAGGVPQDLRIMQRLRLVDLDEIEGNGAECWNLTEWAMPHRGDGGRVAAPASDGEDENEDGPCSVGGPGCSAPAGYLIDGIAVPSDVMADNACGNCGMPVCSTCISNDGYCDDCQEYTFPGVLDG